MTTHTYSPIKMLGTPSNDGPPAPNTSADPNRTPNSDQDPTDVPSRLSPSTVAGYAADWALFTDWASAADQLAVPANPDTVLAFLQDCPAAQATQRRRVTAIDHQHTVAGQPAPGNTDQVRAALGRRVGEWTPNPDVVDQVHQALLQIPSHGWTSGFFGRRDRLILTLTHLAGLTYRDQHHLTGADLQVTDGVLTVVAGRTRTARLDPHPDPRLCPACTTIRWLNVLHIVVTRPAISMLAGPLQRAGSVTSDSTHLCTGDPAVTGRTRTAPLLVPIDRYGGTALPLQPLTPPAIAHLAALGRTWTHPALSPGSISPAVSAVQRQADEMDQPSSPHRAAPAPYTRRDHEQAAAKRATAKTRLAGVSATLDALDDALAALDRRVQAALDG